MFVYNPDPLYLECGVVNVAYEEWSAGEGWGGGWGVSPGAERGRAGSVPDQR